VISSTQSAVAAAVAVAVAASTSSSSPSSSPAAPGPITAYSIPFKIPGSQKDRQRLHYFCVQAATDLSGGLTSSSEFWSTVVLPYSHEEPVVRHALIALSSIHLDYVTTDCPDDQSFDQELTSVETLLQYNKAIRQLRTYLSSRERPSIKVALICCALFYCFESNRGNYESAVAHLRNGLAILRDALAGRTSEMLARPIEEWPEDLQKLVQFFIRLDLQATVFHEGRVPMIEFTSYDERIGAKDIVATDTFRSLHEAQLALDKIRNQTWRFSSINAAYKHVPAEGLPPYIVHEKNHLVRQYKRWSSAMDGLWCQQSGSRASRESATILKVVHGSAEMFILANFPKDSSVFGASPNERGRKIVALIESLRLTDASRRTYASEVGIIAPLAMLGSVCLDPEVMRKALVLLMTSKRREGLLDAQMIVRIGKKVSEARAREGGPLKAVADTGCAVKDGWTDSPSPEATSPERLDITPDETCDFDNIAKVYGEELQQNK
jgi:Fungal specific transcription factor domain